MFDLLDHFRYIVPAGSPMTGIGNTHQVASLSNCFVIGLEGDADSYGAIMKIDEEQVQLMKRRGGVGHDLDQLRPKGSPVNNSALTSTGLVPFMERYSNSTREVAQDGRRGALMLSVSVKHPDAESFIDAKMTEGKVTGANVSVKIDDAFMQAAVADKPYVQRFPVDADQPMVRKEISARDLWHKIVHNAWKSAEPGVLFGTPSCVRASPIAMPIWGSARFRPIPVARFHSAPTTVVDCSASISIAMWRTPSRPQRASISTSLALTFAWPNASWTTSWISRWRRST